MSKQEDTAAHVSVHDSDFDVLHLHTDSNILLLTPSPSHQDFLDMEIKTRPLTSPPLLSCGSSGVCSPSTFLKSPFRTKVQTSNTLQRQRVVRLATPKRLLEAMESIGQEEETKRASSTSNVDEASGDMEKKHGDVVSTSARLTTTSTLSTPEHLPIPSPRHHLHSCHLKNVFDQTDDDDEQQITQEDMKLPSQTYLDADDIHCVPSGSLTSPSEHDSFFSFANSLSPLMVADEFEDSFIPVKLSPLVSHSCELPRLLPPFLEQEPKDDQSASSIAHAYNGTPSVVKTPKNKPNRKRKVSSAASLAGGSSPAPKSASGLVCSNFFAESFPNIQASTSATPGQDERLKLGGHSVMKMKLHTSFGASSSFLDSHSTREIQAINNSLKRKKYIRRRQAEEKRPQTSFFSNVQRKLLQTPVKSSSSSPCTITRSPLHPWNGKTSPAGILETPTPQKLAPSQQTTKVSAVDANSFPSVAQRLIPATDPTPAPATPVKKRNVSLSVFMPSSITNIYGVDVRQAVALAITPAKQIKREVTTTPGKYSILKTSHMVVTCGASRMFISPTPVRSSTSLTTSLQSASEALLGVIPSQVPKKAPCNCKKSKCLKLYCECFRLGGYCDESCNCLDCANTTATEEVRQQAIASRLEKNPNAFKPKIGATPVAAALTTGGAHRLSVSASGGSGSLFSPQQQILSATKMHKHGCHCKKSACQKKYCECFQAGVPCGENCRCVDCKNQTPCAAHGNGFAKRAESTLVGTPSRIASELDETFVSPVLLGVKKRMRIDRETWKKDFSSPLETSTRRECNRTELLQSRLLASRSVGAASTRVSSVPFTSGSTTPQVKHQTGAKRSRGIMSPVRGPGEEERGGSSEAANTLLSPKDRERQQYPFAVRNDSTVGKAALSAVVRSERVFVLPLFGAKLPPLENGVSAKIFCFLTNADLHNASLVSHLWNQVALGDTVWDHANFIPTWRC